jgi:hypothetical protein
MDTPFTIQSGELRYTCFLPVGLVDLVGSSYVMMDTPFTTESGELQLLPAGESGKPGWFSLSVRMVTLFTTESCKLQLLPAGESG